LGKAEVSPTNGHTIPTLELCAAVLSVEIADIVKQELNIDSKDKSSSQFTCPDSDDDIISLSNSFPRIVIGDVNLIGSKMLLMTDNAPLRVKGFNSVQTLKTK
jgi:hypothetical protein